MDAVLDRPPVFRDFSRHRSGGQVMLLSLMNCSSAGPFCGWFFQDFHAQHFNPLFMKTVVTWANRWRKSARAGPRTNVAQKFQQTPPLPPVIIGKN